jgi:hypothetical protein
MIVGQWLAHGSPTPDHFSISYRFSACILERRVSADEKVGCAGYQALLERSIALFVRHVYYDGPSSLSMLWTLECSDWFRMREREDTSRSSGMDVARSVPVSLTCCQAGECGTMQAYPRSWACQRRPPLATMPIAVASRRLLEVDDHDGRRQLRTIHCGRALLAACI